MTDELVKSTPFRHHLLFTGLMIGLMAVIAIFFTRYPMDFPIGYKMTSAGQAQICIRGGSAD